MTVEDVVVEPEEWTYCDVTRKPVRLADTVEFRRRRVSAEGKNILVDRLKFGDPATAGLVRPSFIRRLLGTMLDGFLIGSASGVLMMFVAIPMAIPTAMRGEEPSPVAGLFVMTAVNLIVALLTFFYYAVMHWKFGQTVGKMAAKYKVVNMDGTPITLRTAMLRSFWSNGASILGQALPFVFGAFMPLAAMVLALGFSVYGIANSVALIVDTKYGRALHDRLSGTRVVMLPGYDRPYQPNIPSPTGNAAGGATPYDAQYTPPRQWSGQ